MDSLHGGAGARTRMIPQASLRTPVIEFGPALASFQHIRFCLQYPDDCQSNSAETERVDLTSESLKLLKRVNHRVNVSIVSKSMAYGSGLEDRWDDRARPGRLQRLRGHEATRTPEERPPIECFATVGDQDCHWDRASCPCRCDDKRCPLYGQASRCDPTVAEY